MSGRHFFCTEQHLLLRKSDALNLVYSSFNGSVQELKQDQCVSVWGGVSLIT